MKQFKSLYAVAVLCLSACTMQQPNTTKKASNAVALPFASNAAPVAVKPMFGALIQPPSVNKAVSFKTGVANKLELKCVRDGVSLDRVKDSTMLYSPYPVILNINMSAVVSGKMQPFVNDTVKYKKQLESVIASLPKKPYLIVIENEYCNTQYYTGTWLQYVNMLKAAITVAHAHGIKVADGGMTSKAIKYLISQSYNRTDKQAFAARQGSVGGDRIATAGAFTENVLNAIKTMNVDYVNFHWYQSITDTQDFEAAVKYVADKTGKQVIINELGQSTDANPAVVIALVNSCKKMQLNVVTWYSGNSETGERAQALHFVNGELGANGEAYKAVIK